VLTALLAAGSRDRSSGMTAIFDSTDAEYLVDICEGLDKGKPIANFRAPYLFVAITQLLPDGRMFSLY